MSPPTPSARGLPADNSRFCLFAEIRVWTPIRIWHWPTSRPRMKRPCNPYRFGKGESSCIVSQLAFSYPGSGLPGVHARPGRDYHANPQAPRPSPHAPPKSHQSAHCTSPRPHRARQQQRQALPYCPRHLPPPKGGRPRSDHGSLLCIAQFSSTVDTLATNGLIEMNLYA